MPKVDGEEFPYTKKGKADAKKAKKVKDKKRKKIPTEAEYDKLSKAEQRARDKETFASNARALSKKPPVNNTVAPPTPPAPVQAGIGAMAVQSPTAGGMPPAQPARGIFGAQQPPGAPGGMGAAPKPNMPGMKAGGKVKKKKGKAKVRGAGIARKGVRPTKYR